MIDHHPNLRHRKRSDASPTTQGGQLEEKDITGKEGAKATSASFSFSLSPPPLPTTDSSGYVLVLLRERPILTRLDVGPFLIFYGFLVSLDFMHEQEQRRQENYNGEINLSSFSLVVFPLVMIAHLAIFLVQQSSVTWRARVGYKKMVYISSLPSPESLLSWTHCLVEAPHVDKHQSSHDAGIVSVEYRVQNNEAHNKDNMEVLAIVNFHDIVFRCNIVTEKGKTKNKDDADNFLWNLTEWDDKNESFCKTASLNSGLFHRLRYPINFPLSFYERWRGHKSMEHVVIAQQTYGTNTTPIELPPFLDLLQEQVVAPFFLFQILCVLLWSLDEYWYYAMFTFFALLMFESTVAFNRLKSLQRLRSYTGHSHRSIWVYRSTYPLGENGWVQISVMELVPGDIVSCKQITLRSSSALEGEGYKNGFTQKQQQMNQIPADILLLNGDVVVDESQITGESIPQLKVALENTSTQSGSSTSENNNRRQEHELLDLQDHKQFIVFGGTTLLVSHAGETPLSDISNAPNQGAIGMVLRTGFETCKGSLLRTMAHTQNSIDGIHTRDTYVFIMMLLCCAVASAAMVWEEGWNDPTRNKFRLTLHVIIIVTSVVPPELPMELSLAVTNSVADLIKRKIFCTEVFRIPLAGQVNVCCFDKTGTLTSDEMQLKGVRLVAEITDHYVVKETNMNNNNTGIDADTIHSFTDVLEPNATLPWPALRIMTACHSLAVNTDGPSRGTDGDQADTLIGDPLEKAVFDVSGYKMIKNNALRITNGASDRPETILILQRFGFSSRLKRMSVLARESAGECTWVLAKGAPETLKEFLRSDSIPRNYDEISMQHMACGTRVLAMAYRKLNAKEAKKSVKEISRQTVESDLIFAGFLLLHCPIKTDSGPVVSELWNSGNKIVMITGDAILTAAEVARQVGIIRKRNTRKSCPSTLQLKHMPCLENKATNNDFRADFRFVSLSNNEEVENIENLTLATKHLSRLQKMVAEREVALCISGDALQKLAVIIVGRNQLGDISIGHVTDEKQILLHPATQDILMEIVPMCAVFARCNPRQKEAIVAAFNLGGFITLMCGDGTNDVGALRRSHVGISIISAPEVESKQRAVTKTLSQAKAEQKREHKKRGTKKLTRVRTTSALKKSMRQLQEAQDELDQIELGDASIASPFTSRMVSIKCCKDVLQQGRCTLVTMLQIYKILGVNCLVNAMILSKLFLHGVKQGDRQLTIVGLFVAGLFFFVTRGRPLPNLSSMHPPTSVLCPQALLSISSQFAIHYACMIIATEVALSFVDPYDPSMIPDGPFNPNTLNTCTFLVSVLATVNTFAVNYRGEPFVEPLRQNKMLFRSLQACYAVLFACALEIFPPLNDLFQLAEFPDTTGTGSLEWMTDSFDSDQSSTPLVSTLTRLVKSIGFRSFMTGLMICDTILVFVFERLILNTFEK
mmetsp:Transcript_30054/g.34474  ORF Transcript_30054/g.34474 Transcript_30054/m.34474 type:complete len:1431 (+) Transcript_30054:65-4357(+)